VGISNEPLTFIENFIADQGVTFPILHDVAGVYEQYNIPGGQSPFPRDYIIDANGTIRMAKTEYDPGTMIAIIEELLSGETTALDPTAIPPDQPRLLPNYPNPFNSATTLPFYLPTTQTIRLEIVNLLGQVVATPIHRGEYPAGTHTITWSGQTDHGHPLPSGIYLIQLHAGQHLTNRKIVYLR
jgi:hypothetical protein